MQDIITRLMIINQIKEYISQTKYLQKNNTERKQMPHHNLHGFQRIAVHTGCQEPKTNSKTW